MAVPKFRSSKLAEDFGVPPRHREMGRRQLRIGLQEYATYGKGKTGGFDTAGDIRKVGYYYGEVS
jgi:hypothetical protein